MGGEAEARPRLCEKARPPIHARLVDLDAPGAGANEIVVPQEIEHGILDHGAGEVVPHAAKDQLDLGGGFFRKRRHELGPGGAMAAQARTDPTQHPCGDIGTAIRIGMTHRP